MSAWILRFVNNCRSHNDLQISRVRSPLSVQELSSAENYWLRLVQEENFMAEIQSLKIGHTLTKSAPSQSVRGSLWSSSRRRSSAKCSALLLCSSPSHSTWQAPSHQTDNLLRTPAFAPRWTYIHYCVTLSPIPSRKAVYSVTRGCIVCRRTSARPQPQMLGQLPTERLTPGLVFDHVGVDYAGPVYIKYGFAVIPQEKKSL